MSASKNIPQLAGITGNQLQVLGTVHLNIHIGVNQVIRQLVGVVPDQFLTTDMLLGVDTLGRAPVYWDQEGSVFKWADFVYPVRHMVGVDQPSRSLTRTKVVNTAGDHKLYVRTTGRMVIEPCSACVQPVKVDEPTGTVLEFSNRSKWGQAQLPICAQVTAERTIYVPFINATQRAVCLKPGTVVGTYEVVTNVESVDVGNTHSCNRIQMTNDMLPHSDGSVRPGAEEDRLDKLQSLLEGKNWSHLQQAERQVLQLVLEKNHNVFILETNELGTMIGEPAHIEVVDNTPVRSPNYRYPEKAKQLIDDMIQEMLDKDIIELSSAVWLSPIVLVNKPDGRKRMCLDYRKVNTKLRMDIHPLPRLEELVEATAGQKFYATLDMKDAYYQIKLDEQSRDLTTFTDGVFLYKFKRLPFGLSCSPALFSREMGKMLAPLIKQGWVRNYLDDVILWANSFEELVSRLDTLFEHFIKFGLKLNVSKCDFGQPQVKFLGHIVSEKGCQPDPKNVEAILQMKAPKDVKEVRRFLGMCGFYRKHISQFAKVAVPLTNLTRKDISFVWTPDCQEAFEILKSKMSQPPLLVKADVSKPFMLHTDASGTHVGAVLMQEQVDGTLQPLSYFSKKLKPTETRYSTTDREALAVVLACRQFYHYLWGTRFMIKTDHQPLITVFKKKTKCPRMNRWILEMRDYVYNIDYKSGRTNVVADQLSRPVRPITWRSPDSWLGKTREEFAAAQRNESRWKDLIDYLDGGKLPKHRYPRLTISQFVVDEALLYLVKPRVDGSLQYILVVPSELRQQALRLVHDKESGHLGRKKTIDKAETMFYWPNLKVDVCNYVKSCILCQQFKSSQALQQPWKALPAIDKPLDRISVDLTDMKRGRHGYRYVLTVLDHYSRYVKYYPLRSKTTEEVCTNFKSYVEDYGVPTLVILDNGGEFTSQQFKTLCQSFKIKLGFTLPYHPQGNSLSERMHRTMKTVLSVLCEGHPLQWPKYLGETQRVLNSAIHTSLGEQPHFVFFSRHASRQVISTLPSIDPDDPLVAVTVAHQVIKDTNQVMSRQYLAKANKGRKAQSVCTGDLVWVRAETVVPDTSRKLNVKWWGPCRVKEIVREGGAYRLENVFTGVELNRAAGKLKPYHGEEQWLLEPREVNVEEFPDEPPVSPRVRRPVKRYVEEC